jgi:hypothetical protein
MTIHPPGVNALGVDKAARGNDCNVLSFLEVNKGFFFFEQGKVPKDLGLHIISGEVQITDKARTNREITNWPIQIAHRTLK